MDPGLMELDFCMRFGVFFWSAWPPQANPSLDNFNWAPVIFGGVFVLALIYYAVWGRHTYTGPVELVRDGQREG